MKRFLRVATRLLVALVVLVLVVAAGGYAWLRGALPQESGTVTLHTSVGAYAAGRPYAIEAYVNGVNSFVSSHQSGSPLSGDYANLIERWQKVTYLPMRFDQTSIDQGKRGCWCWKRSRGQETGDRGQGTGDRGQFELL